MRIPRVIQTKPKLVLFFLLNYLISEKNYIFPFLQSGNIRFYIRRFGV